MRAESGSISFVNGTNAELSEKVSIVVAIYANATLSNQLYIRIRQDLAGRFVEL